MTKPIQKLVILSTAISEGQLGIGETINGTREINILGESFNHMSKNLEARFNEQKQAEEKLKQNKESLKELVKERTKELTQANLTLKNLSEIDPLTNIFNRRMYETQLDKEVLSAKRSNQPLSIMVIDIDFFKEYNDHYGHDAGDMILKKIAKAMKENSPRKTDLVARFGGEEFIILMPSTNIEGAYTLAENIRNGIKAINIIHDYSKVTNVVTVSIGISSLQNNELNKDDLFKQADIALYTAKEGGRNQCMVYSN